MGLSLQNIADTTINQEPSFDAGACSRGLCRRQINSAYWLIVFSGTLSSWIGSF